MKLLRLAFQGYDDLKYKYALTENYSEDPENEALAPFLVRNHHEAIVDRETFLLANSVNRQFGMEKGRIRKNESDREKNRVFRKTAIRFVWGLNEESNTTDERRDCLSP